MNILYHIIDKSGILRIGYMTAESVDQAKESMAKWSSVVLTVKESEPPTEQPHRFFFKGLRDDTDFTGTIESTSKRDALLMLIEDYDPKIYYIMSQEEQGSDVSMLTMSTQDLLASLKKDDEHVEKKNKELEDAPKVERDGFLQSYAWQKIDLFLDEVNNVLGSLHGDKQFTEDIKTIQIQHHNLSNTKLSLSEGYSALSLILRELAFIASSMDPTPLQGDIRKLESKNAKLLQLFEKAKLDSKTSATPTNEHRKHIQQLRKQLRDIKHHSTATNTVEFRGSSVFFKEVPFILRVVSLSLIGIFLLLLLFSKVTGTTTYLAFLSTLSRVIILFAGTYIGLYVVEHNPHHPLFRILGTLFILLSILSLIII